jgi:1-acyl-sn-glycerol-3-phosphate acyltransferase
MTIIRSALFMFFMVLLTIFWALYVFLHFPCSPASRRRAVDPWVNSAAWLIEHLLGIRYRVLGAQNIPEDKPMVILSKHQSAWETIVLQKIFPRPIFVWKRELKRLPFFGWALAVHPSISIDRTAGKSALRQLLDQGRKRLAQGFNVIVFPEGTRLAPGQRGRFKIGGAQLAADTGAALIPVAHNAGEVWGREAFVKRPGLVTVSIGVALTGQDAVAMNQQAQDWVNQEMQRISACGSSFDAHSHQ